MEQSLKGKIDILVNNVWGGYEGMFNGEGKYIWEKPFWEQEESLLDLMFSAGVRAHYVASQQACKCMTQANSGLIVNLSCCAANDKLSFDMAQELKVHNISVISLYPSIVRTERVMMAKDFLDLSNSESPQFIGEVIASLYLDKKKLEKSGFVFTSLELGSEYEIVK